MSDTIIGALIGVGSVIIGAIIAGTITYYYSQKLIRQTHKNSLEVSRDAIKSSHENTLEILKRQEFNKAAAIFRSAFVNERYLLRENVINGTERPHEIITNQILIIHEKAKILFEPYLTGKDLIAFNETWEKFKDYNGESYNPAVKEIKIERSKYCLAHIDNLLEYANPK